MKPFISLLFFMFSYTLVFGQDFRIPLWDNKIPNLNNTDVVENYSNEHYYVVTKPDIAVYFPSKWNRTGQAVLIIPGGGYQANSYTLEGTDIAKWLNTNGIVGIVLNYRLPNDTLTNIVRYKSPLLDAERAIRIIRKNANNWGIDKNNIGVMGFSAGGHLAATLGTHCNEAITEGSKDEIDTINARPDFLCLMYPVITMDTTFTHMGSRKNLLGENPTSELINYYSNEKNVTDNTPPTFLLHASDDRSVPVKNSIVFYEALQQHGVKAEMHIYPNGGHGFSLANTKGALSSWKDRCIDWLKNFNK